MKINTNNKQTVSDKINIYDQNKTEQKKTDSYLSVTTQMEYDWVVQNIPFIEQKTESSHEVLSLLDHLIQSRLQTISVSEEKIATWKETWSIIKQQVITNRLQPLFSPNFVTRKNQYLAFMQKLYDALLLLTQKKEDEFFFAEELPSLINVCYTGWQERILQIKARAELAITKNLDLFSLAHQAAGLLRKEIAETKVLPKALEEFGLKKSNLSLESRNAHNLAILTQWAQEHYPIPTHLSISKTQEPLYPFYAPFLSKVAPSIYAKEYTQKTVIQTLQQTYNDLDPNAKKRLWEQIEDLYKTDLLAKKAPLIAPLETLTDLYAQLQDAAQPAEFALFSSRLKQCRAAFLEQGFIPPFSAETPKERLETKLLGTHMRLAFLQGKNILQEMEKKPFLSEEEKRHISSLVLALKKSEEKETCLAYVKQKQQELLSALQNKKQYEAKIQASLLKSLFEDEKEHLRPFGAVLWGTLAKLLIQDPLRPAPADPLLLWAKHVSLPSYLTKRPARKQKEYSLSPVFIMPERIRPSNPYLAFSPLSLSKFSLRQKKRQNSETSLEKELFLYTFKRKKRRKRYQKAPQYASQFPLLRMDFLV